MNKQNIGSRPCKTLPTRMNSSFFIWIVCTKSLRKRFMES